MGRSRRSGMLFCCILATISSISQAMEDLSPQPAMALIENGSSKIIGITEWRDIDFGNYNTVTEAGGRPARAFALQTTVTIKFGDSFAGEDNQMARDYFLIPLCNATGTPQEGPTNDLCSLRHLRGYLQVRLREGWESLITASLWQNARLSSKERGMVDIFEAINNGGSNITESNYTAPVVSNMLFPKDLESERGKRQGHSSVDNSDTQYKVSRTCRSLGGECFQRLYMSYSKSFDNIPEKQFSARIALPLGVPGDMNMPWVLQLSSTSPFDTPAEMDIVLVLIDTLSDARWSIWLFSTTLGRIVVLTVSLVLLVGFVTGTRWLGVRLARSVPQNERRVAALYRGIGVHEPLCVPLSRVFVALIETLVKVRTSLLALCCGLGTRIRNICSGERIYTRINADGVGQGNNADSIGMCGDQLVSMTVVDVEAREGGEESLAYDGDGNQLLCRICHSVKPAEDLFAPCACSGSSRYIHKQCLQRWRKTTSNKDHRRLCAECKTPYRIRTEPKESTSRGFQDNCKWVHILVVAILSPVLFVGQSSIGGYYLKCCMYIATGFDAGVIWSAFELYHWILAFYFLVALLINIHGLQHELMIYNESWQQLILLLLSLFFVQIPLYYVAQVLSAAVLNTSVSIEVFYGLGIVASAVFYAEVLPLIQKYLEPSLTE
ncbi:hypothetical protein TRVL_03864 [Trypanosoma vivax]|nr:hypothetical protein TRVL_03864 [Trypanosoma vivax]